MQIVQKSILAKLLATEDIAVEHQNVSTAMFDLKNRKVILPRWKEMSVDLYDLLVGHEISHGLETPLEGWHDALCEKGQGFKSFLNVIEDARIEKKVKLRYPGLVKSFSKGYKELMDKDFFGLNGRDLDTLPLIDRINLKFKCGNMLGIKFDETEMYIVNRTALCETWEDVVLVATDLYEYSKDEKAMQDQLSDNTTHDYEDDEEEEDSESGETSSMEESDDSEESDADVDTEDQGSDGETGDDAEEAESNDDEPATQDQRKSDSGEIDEGTPEPESFTDTAFRNNEENLVEVSDLEILNGTFPKINTSAFVMQADEVWNYVPEYHKGNSGYYYRQAECENNAEVESTLFKSFQSRNKSAINLLVQQFEMRRKATSLKKSRENKTGLLNDKKLWAYKLSDDLFLSTTTTPDGQNHGMFMLVDMSGSMHGEMTNVIEQLLIQVSFCKKVGIPFDVYGFSNAHDTEKCQSRAALQAAQSLRNGDFYIDDDNFRLLQLISSELSAPMYSKSFKMLLGYATGFLSDRQSDTIYCDRGSIPQYMHLSATPLSSAILVARDVANKFKERNRIEVLNTIVLTDGYNTDQAMMIDEVSTLEGTDYSQIKFQYGVKKVSEVYIKEGAVSTKYVTADRYGHGYRMGCGISSQDYFLALLTHYKNTTGSRMICFNLVSGRSCDVRDAYFTAVNRYDYEGFTAGYKTFKAEKFMEITQAVGYDSMFMIMGGKGLEVDTDDLEVKSNSKGDLKRGFMKFAKGRSASRVFLNRFIDKVA